MSLARTYHGASAASGPLVYVAGTYGAALGEQVVAARAGPAAAGAAR